MSTNNETTDARLIAATSAVRDKCGSRLCNWVDQGTERECWSDSGHQCLCQNVAMAVMEAINV